MAARRPDADRRTRQNDRLARLLRILQFIQSRDPWTARRMAQELECSERTVFRHLQVLSLAGIPWYHDQNERCYRVRSDFRFPVLNLTDDEILGQAIATVVTKARGLDLGNGAGPTTEKLAAASSERVQTLLADASQLVAVLDLKLADHSRHREVIRTTQWGLIQRKQLLGDYRSPYQDKPVRLHLHPYRLCLVNQAWYLIAKSTGANGPRTYRIARFKTLRMLDTTAEVPEDFDLKAYFGNAWAVYRGEQSYEVEIEFTKDAAELVTETTWHPTQKQRSHKDGRVTLNFQVDGLEEILWWVLGWAGRATVIKPEELRDMVLGQMRQALEMNQP